MAGLADRRKTIVCPTGGGLKPAGLATDVDQVRDPGFVGVADHPFDAGKGGQFVGGALGVAAGHQDAGPRILTVDAADGLADIVVG